MTTGALRDLRLEDPLEHFPEVIARIEREHGKEAARKLQEDFGIREDVLPDAPIRPGRRGRSDPLLAAWARAYVDQLRHGNRRPVAALAHHPPMRFLGSDGEPVARVSENTVRDLLKEARRRGLLSPAPRGRAGGFLTDRANELLAQPPR